MFVKVLDDEQIDKIHRKSLNILENIGVVVPHEEVLARFVSIGAQYNFLWIRRFLEYVSVWNI